MPKIMKCPGFRHLLNHFVHVNRLRGRSTALNHYCLITYLMVSSCLSACNAQAGPACRSVSSPRQG